MSINWNNIRSLNNSQNEGFEELVCQLARKEKVQNKLRFIRKGKPDAGVECFCIKKDGAEFAWQAKFFTNSLTDGQWGQLDKSVKTALSKHPKMSKYYIALPIDPPDARKENETSMLQKWNKHVEKWKGWASEQSIEVDFIPWWSSDLIARLQKPENEGLTYFWFQKEEFTNEWFKKHIEIATVDLGTRYTSEVNFKLEVANIFDGVARDKNFNQQFQNALDEGLIQLKKLRGSITDEQLINEQSSLSKCIKNKAVTI